MRDIWTSEEEARRLQARFAELKTQGVGQAAFARKYKIPGGASMVSQHIKNRRPIDITAATAYANGFKCHVSEISPRLAKAAIAAVSTIHEISDGMGQKTKPDELVIPQFDTGGAMGIGLLLRDQPGVIQRWVVNDEWVRKNIKSHTGVANLCIVTGFGDSMKGMFNSGDPLVVDRGVKAVDFDAVYFFRVADEGFIKRLQRIPGEGVRVLSENKKYDSWTIRPDMDFEVFGRVLKAWQGEDF